MSKTDCVDSACPASISRVTVDLAASSTTDCRRTERLMGRRSEPTVVSEDAESGDTAGSHSRADKRALGLALLEALEFEELPLSAAIDRLETVTTDPRLTREILDTAETRGLIDREGTRIRTRRGGTFVRFESQVRTREGKFTCRRCGAGLSTGHFIIFEAGELGPFGSSCIRIVLGRDD